MMTVPLHGDKAAGRVVQVADVHYLLAMRYRWNVWGPYSKEPGRKPIGPYAITTPYLNGRQVTIRMHTLITGYARVDHIDHDGLNNQWNNLRPASAAQNQHNRTPNVTPAYSPFKGVTWRRNQPIKPWTARIRIDGTLCFLGSFAEETAAARAYDAAALEAFGEFAYLNFPTS